MLVKGGVELVDVVVVEAGVVVVLVNIVLFIMHVCFTKNNHGHELRYLSDISHYNAM